LDVFKEGNHYVRPGNKLPCKIERTLPRNRGTPRTLKTGIKVGEEDTKYRREREGKEWRRWGWEE